ncbi:deoxycytidine triphosphate deaminase [Mycobacterium xenopi 4042]|uniref:Deoxycytidine triphosphate deaminase n=1 Tax=Mycobacterium xenopi 4042 TaxID=1299334 RepID=X7ZAD8_MYCXE|nr:deoxycytidine triphosphate deaminase [Mycobacterium xenopi 4042]
MLLSDRDLRAEIDAGRLIIDPFDDALVQPSSVDVRLDSLFRVFNNTRYTHIDPAQQQDELTSLVQPVDGEPFVLHPGEFVLGSTLELCTLPDDLAGRLEGKSSLGGWVCSPTRRRASSTRDSAATSPWSSPTSPTCRSHYGRA